MKDEVQKIAVEVFKSVLRVSGGEPKSGDHGLFNMMLTTRINGEVKPLLLKGNAHHEIEDGHCIAILNPDPSLSKEVKAGMAYPGDTLKKIVEGRCDYMVDLWIDAYKPDDRQVGEVSSYKSRTPSAAKFKVH
jgi:hypothetical protein